MLGAKFATLLLVAAVIGTSYSQECELPTASDLEGVIPSIIQAGDAAAPPAINLIKFHFVCRSFTEEQDRLRGVSVVVQYTCTGHSNCPSGSATVPGVVEQMEFGCVGGQWTNDVEGISDSNLIRSQNTQATVSTTTRDNCSGCLSPELASNLGGSVTTDSVTHCLGK